jgi:hypothetical protein
MGEVAARVAAAWLTAAALLGVATGAHAERTLSAHPLDLVRDGRQVTLLLEVRHIDLPPDTPSGLAPRACPASADAVDGCYRLRIFHDSMDVDAVAYTLLGSAGNADLLLARYATPKPTGDDGLIDLALEINGVTNGNADEHFPTIDLPGTLETDQPFAFLHARSDDALNAAYRRLRLQLGAERRDEAAALQAAQRDWLTASRVACGDPAGREDEAVEDWARCQWQRDAARLLWLREQAITLGVAQPR